MKRVYKTLYHAMTNAWKTTGAKSKNSVRFVDFCELNVFTAIVLVIFLLQNGTYYPNVPRTYKKTTSFNCSYPRVTMIYFNTFGWWSNIAFSIEIAIEFANY